MFLRRLNDPRSRSQGAKTKPATHKEACHRLWEGGSRPEAAATGSVNACCRFVNARATVGRGQFIRGTYSVAASVELPASLPDAAGASVAGAESVASPPHPTQTLKSRADAMIAAGAPLSRFFSLVISGYSMDFVFSRTIALFGHVSLLSTAKAAVEVTSRLWSIAVHIASGCGNSVPENPTLAAQLLSTAESSRCLVAGSLRLHVLLLSENVESAVRCVAQDFAGPSYEWPISMS